MPPHQSSVSGRSQLNWDELDFRHLKFAVTVAEQQSFVQAADHLRINQGFLSRQIRYLEKRLGFELFDRSRRSPLALTESGQAFLKDARFILAQTQHAIESAQQINRGEKGHLTIGINTSISNSKLPDILRSFYLQYIETLHGIMHSSRMAGRFKQYLHIKVPGAALSRGKSL